MVELNLQLEEKHCMTMIRKTVQFSVQWVVFRYCFPLFYMYISTKSIQTDYKLGEITKLLSSEEDMLAIIKPDMVH